MTVENLDPSLLSSDLSLSSQCSPVDVGATLDTDCYLGCVCEPGQIHFDTVCASTEDCNVESLPFIPQFSNADSTAACWKTGCEVMPTLQECAEKSALLNSNSYENHVETVDRPDRPKFCYFNIAEYTVEFNTHADGTIQLDNVEMICDCSGQFNKTTDSTCANIVSSTGTACQDIETNADDCKTAAEAVSYNFVGQILTDDNTKPPGCFVDSNKVVWNTYLPSSSDPTLSQTHPSICNCVNYKTTTDCVAQANSADLMTVLPSEYDENAVVDFYISDTNVPESDKPNLALWFDDSSDGLASPGGTVNTNGLSEVYITLTFASSFFKFRGISINTGPTRDFYPSSVEVQVSDLYPEDVQDAVFEDSFTTIKTITGLPEEDYVSNSKLFDIVDLYWPEQICRSVRLKFGAPATGTTLSLSEVRLLGQADTFQPTKSPTVQPSFNPTDHPTFEPTMPPVTSEPSEAPVTSEPSPKPTMAPSPSPTFPLISGPSTCYGFQTSLNVYKYPSNSSFNDVVGSIKIGAVPYIGDIDAEIHTACDDLYHMDSFEWQNCTEPFFIESTFRITTPQGYVGVEFWEEDEDLIKWNLATQHMRFLTDKDDGYTMDDCTWPDPTPEFPDKTKDCDLLPLTSTVQYALRAEIWCEKRPYDERKAGFIVSWRDATGVQYTYRPVINDTLTRMHFTTQATGTSLEPSQIWKQFKPAIIAISLLAAAFILICMQGLCTESARTGVQDFALDTRMFRTDEKLAMSYIPKTAFNDELTPLKTLPNPFLKDESIIRTFAKFAEDIKSDGDGAPGFRLHLFKDAYGEDEIGDIELFAKKSFSSDKDALHPYSARIEQWMMDEDPPYGLRFGCYMTRIRPQQHTIAEVRDDGAKSDSLKGLTFDEVRQKILETKKERESLGGDFPFFVEFRDNWQDRPFEYKLMRSKLDQGHAVHWTSLDVHYHTKDVLALRERRKWKTARHCPYLVIIIVFRILYMILFTFTVCSQLFIAINNEHFDVLNTYDSFANERDTQLWNMSQRIEFWYETHRGRSNITDQVDILKAKCYDSFTTDLDSQIADEEAWQKANHTGQMDQILLDLDMEKYEYIAIIQAEDKTCEWHDDPSYDGFYEDQRIGCGDSEAHVEKFQTASLDYSECVGYCWNYNTIDQWAPEVYDWIEANQPSNTLTKNCTHVTYFYDTHCCDLHLIEAPEEECNLYDTGQPFENYDYGRYSALYTANDQNIRYVTGYIELKFCGNNYDEFYISQNEVWLDSNSGYSDKPYAGMDSACNAIPGGYENKMEVKWAPIGTYDPDSGQPVGLSDGEKVDIWADKTNITPDEEGGHFTIPDAGIPESCYFYTWANDIWYYLDWDFPSQFSDQLGFQDQFFTVTTSNDLRQGKIVLPYTTGSNGDGELWWLKLPMILKCDRNETAVDAGGDDFDDGCFSFDELCRLGKSCANQPSWCECYTDYSPADATNCKFPGSLANTDNVDMTYNCRKFSHIHPLNSGTGAITLVGSTLTFAACQTECTNNENCRSFDWVASSAGWDYISTTGECGLWSFGESSTGTNVLDQVVWNDMSVMCAKHEAFAFQVGNKTCGDDTVWPYGTELGSPGMDLEACEDLCWSWIPDGGEQCYALTYYTDTGRCFAHDVNFCDQAVDQEEIFYTSVVRAPPRTGEAVLATIEDRETAKVLDWASPDLHCNMGGGAIYETSNITTSEVCDSQAIAAGYCEDGDKYYTSNLDPTAEDVDLFQILKTDCQSNDWCVGFSVRNSDNAYFRYHHMGDPVLDTSTSGYCVEFASPTKWIPPDDVSDYYARQAQESEEEREEAINDLNVRYDEILGGLWDGSNGNFHLTFDNSVDNPGGYGFGDGDYTYSASGGSQDDNSAFEFNYFIPFNCPGCPNEYELPDTISSDFVSDYVNNATVPETDNFTADSIVVVPDLDLQLIDFPDLWDWELDLNLPNMSFLQLFLVITVSFDLILTFYRIWHTSAVAAEIIRGQDVMINMKYLRDADALVDDHKCCEGRNWADMFLSCFLYIHDKIFNFHFYCWRVCPYILLLINLAMLTAFILAMYVIIYQIVDIDVFEDLGFFAGMTAAIGTQKAIRNEVLCYDALYYNTDSVNGLDFDINQAAANSITYMYDVNAAELDRVNEFNGNLEESFRLFFNNPREIGPEDYLDTSTLHYSSGGDNINKIWDDRLTNGGWKPDYGETASTSTTLEPTDAAVIPPETDEPTFAPTTTPSYEPTVWTTFVTQPVIDGQLGYTGFQYDLKPEELLPNNPFWRINSLTLQFRYYCYDGIPEEDQGSDALEYTISFLAETSENHWEWVDRSDTFPGKQTAYQLQSDGTERCISSPQTCNYCSASYTNHDVRAIKVSFPDSADFGNSQNNDTTAYELSEMEVEAYIAPSNVDVPYVTYYSIYVDPWLLMNKTCPNGVTPVFGYMFRGFSRAEWNDDLKEGHRPYVWSMRQIMLSPFVILLVLVILYTVAALCQFVFEMILVRADMLRQNPYTHVPLIEHCDQWKIKGLRPNYPKHEPYTKVIERGSPVRFLISEYKRGMMTKRDWKQIKIEKFHVRVYDIHKNLVMGVRPAPMKDKKFATRMVLPNSGVFFIEVTYNGLPIGHSPYEVDVVEPDDPKLRSQTLREEMQELAGEKFDEASVHDLDLGEFEHLLDSDQEKSDQDEDTSSQPEYGPPGQSSIKRAPESTSEGQGATSQNEIELQTMPEVHQEGPETEDLVEVVISPPTGAATEVHQEGPETVIAAMPVEQEEASGLPPRPNTGLPRPNTGLPRPDRSAPPEAPPESQSSESPEREANDEGFDEPMAPTMINDPNENFSMQAEDYDQGNAQQQQRASNGREGGWR